MLNGVILERFEQSYEENLGYASPNLLLLENLTCRNAPYRAIFLSAVSSIWHAPFSEFQTKFIFATCDGSTTSNVRQVLKIRRSFYKRQPHKMVKNTQPIRRLLPTNCLSVSDHFVGLALSSFMTEAVNI